MADVAANGTVGWVPVIAALLGFVTSSVTEWFRGRQTNERDRMTAETTAAREREAREAIRRAELFEKRASFQRETLLSVQDSVVKLARAAGKLHHFDAMEYRKTGKWGPERGQLLPPDLNDEAFNANVAVMVMT